MAVTALEILTEAECRGVRFRTNGDRLEATPSNLLDERLSEAIANRKADLMALIHEREGACATDAVLFAQALLRQGRFVPESAPCAFHCGYLSELCRRCARPFADH